MDGSGHMCVTPSQPSSRRSTRDDVSSADVNAALSDPSLKINQSSYTPYTPSASNSYEYDESPQSSDYFIDRIEGSRSHHNNSAVWIALIAVAAVMFFLYKRFKNKKTQVCVETQSQENTLRMKAAQMVDAASKSEFASKMTKLSEIGVEKVKENVGNISIDGIKDKIQSIDTEEVGKKAVSEASVVLGKVFSFVASLLRLCIQIVVVLFKIIIAIISAIVKQISDLKSNLQSSNEYLPNALEKPQSTAEISPKPSE